MQLEPGREGPSILKQRPTHQLFEIPFHVHRSELVRFVLRPSTRCSHMEEALA